jgi:hypothetical protein
MKKAKTPSVQGYPETTWRQAIRSLVPWCVGCVAIGQGYIFTKIQIVVTLSPSDKQSMQRSH